MNDLQRAILRTFGFRVRPVVHGYSVRHYVLLQNGDIVAEGLTEKDALDIAHSRISEIIDG